MAKQFLTKLKCSFCGKSEDQVQQLIAGPKVHICNECIGLCNDILEKEKSKQVSDIRPADKPIN